MTWNSLYLSPDTTPWKGRAGTPPDACFFQIVQLYDLLQNTKLPPINTEKPGPRFGIIGFRCDEGVRRNQGRPGAAEGPTAIRHALAKCPIQKQHFQLFDAGNIVCLDHDLEASQQALGEVINILFEQKIIPIVIGGGHELAWGHYQGIMQAFPDKNVGIINFDSHFDMRPLLPNSQGSSGTSFLQIADALKKEKKRFDYNCIGIQHSSNIRQVLDTAKAHDTKIMWADEIHQGQLEKCVDFIDRVIDQNEIIYLTLCLDVFASAFAPGVSAIQPLGLYPWHVLPLIRQLAASGKVISYDIVEMCPRYDIDQATAKLAAILIFEFIHHHNEMPRDW